LLFNPNTEQKKIMNDIPWPFSCDPSFDVPSFDILLPFHRYFHPLVSIRFIEMNGID